VALLQPPATKELTEELNKGYRRCAVGSTGRKRRVASRANSRAVPGTESSRGIFMRYRVTSLLSMAFCLLLALAQQISRAAENTEGIPEIVVTATKYGETNLQTTPLTMDVVGTEELQLRQVHNAEDLVSQVPGLVFDQGSSSPRIALRGVSQDQFLIEAENPVATYVDGVYLTHNWALLVPYNDVERVEVLKGPQGATFGRNASGGALLYISKLPEPGFSGTVAGSYGSFNRREVYGALNGGQENLSARVSSYYDQDDGFVRNLFTGQELNARKQYGARGSVLFEPSETLKVVGRLSYDRLNTSFGAQGNVSSPGIGALFGGVGILYQQHEYDTESELLNPRRDSSSVIGSITADLDLGKVHVKSVSGYVRTRYIDVNDYDHTSIPFLLAPTVANARQYSEELQFSGDVSRLHWLAGAYYLNDKADDLLGVDAGTQLQIPGAALFTSQNQQLLRSTAGFVAAKVDVSDRSHLNAGYRYTKDEKTLQSVHILFPLGFPSLVTCDNTFNHSWSASTFEVGADTALTDNNFAYARYSRGFKAGGFASQACPNVYDPEKIDAFEVGLKNKLFEGHLVVNAAAFYYKYQNMQVSLITPIPGTFSTISNIGNAAESKIYGLDLDFRAGQTKGWSADGGLTWLPKASYERFVTFDPYVAAFGPFGGAVPPSLQAHGTVLPNNFYDLSGNRLNRAPKLMGILGSSYQANLVSNWTYTVRVEGQYTGAQQYSPFNRTDTEEPGRFLANAYLTLANAGGFSINAYGKNLFNKFYAADRYDNSTILTVPFEYGRPREGGVEFVYSF
jgi:iron complex outermembrane receptor protein